MLLPILCAACGLVAGILVMRIFAWVSPDDIYEDEEITENEIELIAEYREHVIHSVVDYLAQAFHQDKIDCKVLLAEPNKNIIDVVILPTVQYTLMVNWYTCRYHLSGSIILLDGKDTPIIEAHQSGSFKKSGLIDLADVDKFLNKQLTKVWKKTGKLTKPNTENKDEDMESNEEV